MDHTRIRDVSIACSLGVQNCHVCDDFNCGDNVVSRYDRLRHRQQELVKLAWSVIGEHGLNNTHEELEAWLKEHYPEGGDCEKDSDS